MAGLSLVAEPSYLGSLPWSGELLEKENDVLGTFEYGASLLLREFAFFKDQVTHW